jgi:predicted nucleotidyltransferase
MKTILKTLVGSRAHNLNREDSDYDWRGVFVEPTSEILKLGGETKETHWIEGKEDDTQYEIGRFLFLATKNNPTILEVMCSPVKEATEEGFALRGLFDDIWEPKRVMDAFVGYGMNQRKKFLDDKDNRANKYAVAYYRALWQAKTLLEERYLPIEVKGDMRVMLMNWKVGNYAVGEVMQKCFDMETEVKKAYDSFVGEKRCNIDKVNSFLLEVRKSNW